MRILKKLYVVLTACALCAAAACSDSETGGSSGAGTDAATSTETGPGIDSSTADSSTADTSVADSGQCNSHANGGPAVAETEVAAVQPAATGGTLLDGTYFLTDYTINTGVGGAAGPTGSIRKSALVVSGAATGTATIQLVGSNSTKNGGADARGTFTAVISGNNLNVTFTCGPTQMNTLGFTVNAGGFLLLDPANDNVQTFVKQ